MGGGGERYAHRATAPDVSTSRVEAGHPAHSAALFRRGSSSPRSAGVSWWRRRRRHGILLPRPACRGRQLPVLVSKLNWTTWFLEDVVWYLFVFSACGSTGIRVHASVYEAFAHIHTFSALHWTRCPSTCPSQPAVTSSVPGLPITHITHHPSPITDHRHHSPPFTTIHHHSPPFTISHYHHRLDTRSQPLSIITA